MRVAIVHYHLRPGGVTRVIENAVAALSARNIQTVVLSGEAYEGEHLPNVKLVEGLDYRYAADDPGPSPAELASRMQAAAREGLGGKDPDLWHIHNHSLGKNVAFPYALGKMLDGGASALLQIHDFAEDGRPGNYSRLTTPSFGVKREEQRRYLYPLSPSIHYALLNGRDAEIMKKAGVPAEQVHLLSNPVSVPDLPDAPPELFDGKRTVLYPCRGIRRKNLGELALLSALNGDDTVFAQTLPPANPEWKPYFDHWKALVEELSLPVHLGYGQESDLAFTALIGGADTLCTTSIAEGFGLAFLEAPLFGKPLVGRDLPEITADFKALGVRFDGLYEHLRVPVEATEPEKLHARLATAMHATWNAYGRPIPEEAVEELFVHHVKDDQIEFGVLDEESQSAVVRDVAASEDVRRSISVPDLHDEAPRQYGEANRQIVEEHFSLEAFGEKLVQAYQGALSGEASAPQDSLSPARLLSQFLNPERFRLLRT